MSILDGKRLVTHSAPRTYGDQLPGRYPHYKDGVEEEWTRTEAKAIRGLAAGYSPQTVAKKLHLKLRTVRRWMGSPYFMMEVQRLADHYLFRFRPKVLEAVAVRAIEGSPQHARLFLLVTKDLKDEQTQTVKASLVHSYSEDEIPPERLDDVLEEELERFLGEKSDEGETQR